MNNLKKTGIGLLVAVLAFSFSAFTAYKRQTVFVYYKINMTFSNPADPQGYVYYSGDICEAGGKLCSAQWDIGSNLPPVQDGEPLPLTGITYQTNSVVTGHAVYY